MIIQCRIKLKVYKSFALNDVTITIALSVNLCRIVLLSTLMLSHVTDSFKLSIKVCRLKCTTQIISF